MLRPTQLLRFKSYAAMVRGKAKPQSYAGSGRARSTTPEPEQPSGDEFTEEDDIDSFIYGAFRDNSTSYDASPCEGSRPKRQKIHSDLTNEEEESMVDWIRETECLYNRKLTEYRETQKKDQLWADKAKEMGKKVDVLRVWYKSIRTRFVKLTKKKFREGPNEFTERDDWVLKKFSFLAQHIGKVRPRTTLRKLNAASYGSGACPSSAVGLQVRDEEGTRETAPMGNPSPRGDRKGGRSKTSIAEGQDEASMLGISQRSEQSLRMQERMLAMFQPRVVNERTAYADWMKTVIEGFETSVWRDFQYECSQLIYKHQRRNDLVLSGQTSHQSTSSSQISHGLPSASIASAAAAAETIAHENSVN